MPLKSDREYRDIVHGLEIRKQNEEEYEGNEKIVEGYATTFNEEYCLWKESDYEVWERVAPTAFDECDMNDVIMQYDHQGRVFARTANKTLSLSMDEHGLKVEANLGGTEIGRNLYEEIKGGYTNKMSFGFIVDEDETERIDNYSEGRTKIVRTITKIRKLFDVSAVSLPANDGTQISSRCFCEGVITEAKEELRKRQEIETERERLLLLIKSMEV